MENAENEGNKTKTHLNNPPPHSAHYNRVVYIVLTILCICVHIPSGSGYKKEFYLQFLKQF